MNTGTVNVYVDGTASKIQSFSESWMKKGQRDERGTNAREVNAPQAWGRTEAGRTEPSKHASQRDVSPLACFTCRLPFVHPLPMSAA